MSETNFSDAIDKLKESFLLAAAQGGNTQDCESLIEFGADINWKNADGDTPLLAATRRGHTETISLLLAYGADSNICGADSLTPLHISTRRGDSNSVNIILDANTDPTVRTKDGQTALDIARAKGYENIYARLMEKRSNISRQRVITTTEAPSTVLINNVRNELPAILQRTGSAGANGGVNSSTGNSTSNSGTTSSFSNSFANESRQLRNLGRLVNPTIDNNRARTSGGANINGSEDEPRLTIDSESIQKSNDSANNMRNSQSRSGNRRISQEAANNNPKNNTKSTSTTSNSNNNNSKNNYTLMDSATHSSTLLNKNHTTTTTHKNNNSHNSSNSQQQDEATLVALRSILDEEISTRKALEKKLSVFKDQNSQLLEEFACLSQQLTESQEEYNQLEHHLNRLLGEDTALETVSIEECEELEKTLKNALQKIDQKKTILIKNRIGNHNEQRMCVICQENEKSVVLLPCRHLCLCSDCSEHDLLTHCPLCRESIAHKISVFS